jgi:hypothetical protein
VIAVIALALRQKTSPHSSLAETAGSAASESPTPDPLRQRDARSLLYSSGSPRLAGTQLSQATPGLGNSPTSQLARLAAILFSTSEAAEAAELPREQLDRWMASGRTNAADLLAARQAGGGMELLKVALERFPDDPRVLLQATALKDEPEAQRQRLDRLKAAAPDNALADYLSAKDHLKNGRLNEALADLKAAAGKTRFQDYSFEAAIHGEEIYLNAGMSPVEAKALGSTTVLLPHLAQLKELASEMGSLQQRYLADGETASAEALARMGVQLGRHLESESNPHSLIHDLVGSAIEQITVRNLPADAQPEFLGMPVEQYLRERDARRAELRALSDGFQDWFQGASEADVIGYFDRLKTLGEVAALNWMRDGRGPKP